MFARKTSEPLTSLVKQIDKKIGENEKLKAFVVVLTGKGEATRGELEKMAKEAGIKHVPLTMVQDPAGPPDYEIAKEADYTVLMWHKVNVKANRAYKGELTDKDIEAVMGDLSKILSD